MKRFICFRWKYGVIDGRQLVPKAHLACDFRSVSAILATIEISRCMKFIFGLIGVLSIFQSVAQCPTDTLTFVSQTEVDNFAVEYPDCTEVIYEINAVSESEDDPILNLDGLSNLTYINSLQITNLGFVDTITGTIELASLNGLENLDSLHFFASNGTGIGNCFIESLDPIEALEGWMTRFNLRDTHIDDDLPDFAQIDSIGEFALSNCNGFSITPSFPNLLKLGSFSLSGFQNGEDSLQTVHIPNGVTDMSLPVASSPTLGLFVANAQNLTEITGGENLVKAHSIGIINNIELENLSVFDSVTELTGSLRLSSCNAGLFNAFKDLRKAGDVLFFFNPEESGLITCSNPVERLDLQVGENADSLIVDQDIGITVNNADTINITGAFLRAGSMSIRIDAADYITGFDDLERISGVGGMQIESPGFAYLPSFPKLRRIDQGIRVSLGNESSLIDFSGLDSLLYTDKLEITGTNLDGIHQLESLNGLQGLDTLNRLDLRKIPSLTDITALAGVVYMDRMEIRDVPELESVFTFDSISIAENIRFENTGLSALPQFTGLTSTESLQIKDNPNLQNTSGLSELTSISGIAVEISDNASLTIISFGEEPTMVGEFTVSNNPALENCAGSETICSLIASASASFFSGNGDNCNSVGEISDNCLLSTENRDDPDFLIFPNPAAEKLNIDGVENFQNLEVRILNAQGTVVKTQRINRMGIDISGLTPGVYFIQVIEGDQIGKGQRFVKL